VKATINQFNGKEAKGYEFGFEYCGAAIERQRSGVPQPSDNVRHVGVSTPHFIWAPSEMPKGLRGA